MAKYSEAVWRDAHVRPGDRSNGGMRSYQWAVLHVNVSNGNLFNWVSNPVNQMSCHFEVYKDGSIEQYVDTSVSSWCQQDGNDSGLSIETEGFPEESLTDAQIGAIAGLLAWINETHGIPLQISDAPSTPGFAWHGEGGAAWGGHPSCPGDLRKAQRQKIITMAKTHFSGDGSLITDPTATEGDDDMLQPFAIYFKDTANDASWIIALDWSSKIRIMDPDQDRLCAAVADPGTPGGPWYKTQSLTALQLKAIPDRTVY